MKEFIQQLDPTRIHRIRIISLEMSRDALSWSWGWANDNIPTAIKTLTGLTTLHVSIRPAYLRHYPPQVHSPVTTGILARYPDGADMLRRGTLSWWKSDLALIHHQKLRCVTVIFRDDITCPMRTSYWILWDQELLMRQSGHWTTAERVELARLLGEKLLASFNAISEDTEIANSTA